MTKAKMAEKLSFTVNGEKEINVSSSWDWGLYAAHNKKKNHLVSEGIQIHNRLSLFINLKPRQNGEAMS